VNKKEIKCSVTKPLPNENLMNQRLKKNKES